MRLLIPFVLFFLKFASADDNDDGLGTDTLSAVVLKMEQSFDHGKSYSSRGSITIQSLKSGSVSIQQSDLSDQDKSALQRLCEVDGLYLIRAVSNQEPMGSYR